MILIAATAPLLVAASAIGLDTIQVTLAKRQLQRSADSAAMAGASARAQKQDTASAVAAVDRDLSYNNSMALLTPRVIENAPTSGDFAGDQRAVRVVLKASRSVPFMSFFTGSSMEIEVEATAAAVPTGNYCVVSLESTTTTGITFAGNATVNLGCGVATNSTGATAITVNGNPNVTASPVAARGGVPTASSFLGTTTVIPNSPAQPDPFATLANPTLPALCLPKLVVDDKGKDAAATPVMPGCYKGLDFKGKATLSPGVYYIDGDELSFGSQADVAGTGVTFVLTSSNIVSNPASVAGLKMNGGASVRLIAPTAGEYANLLIYQDRRASASEAAADGETDKDKADKYHINGGSNSILDGAIYMPKSQVTFNGGSGLDVRCLRLVTLRIKFSGNTTMVNNCPTNHPTRGFTGLTIRLVG
jgi:hypothetical protein